MIIKFGDVVFIANDVEPLGKEKISTNNQSRVFSNSHFHNKQQTPAGPLKWRVILAQQ